MYAGVWEKVDRVAEISFEPTIEGALMLAKRIGEQVNGMQTLVTGSLHLVGNALSLLKPSGPA
jgi:folylpolyglutamate synthase